MALTTESFKRTEPAERTGEVRTDEEGKKYWHSFAKEAPKKAPKKEVKKEEPKEEAKEE